MKGKKEVGPKKVKKRPLWCFHEEGGIDVVWGLRFVFVSVTILETIMNQSCMRQAGLNAHFHPEMSLLDTWGEANIDCLYSFYFSA